LEPEDYCRDIERYLCRKNDGHLIRIVGPAFEQVSRWASEGIPFSVACSGIDRYFERYYRKGPRRRPVRIEFCEADVRDAFDDWRRAVGVVVAARAVAQSDESGEEGSRGTAEPGGSRRPSLAAHIERGIARLTALRASSQGTQSFTGALEDAARVLDRLHPEAKRARGESREAILRELVVVDEALMAAVLTTIDQPTREAAEREAKEALSPYRDRMAPDAYQQATRAAVERYVRNHFGLPTIRF
jgi:hypothetical protein